MTTVMTSATATATTVGPRITIGIRAWNEEAVIRKTLESVFQQSIFEELARRGERCEVLCIPNGCTDRTAEIAEKVFAEQRASHPFAHAFTCRVDAIKEAGRNHTWNAFVHSLSSPEAEYLFVMDSDILFDQRDSLFNMYAALLENPVALVASDRALKHISLKQQKSLLDRISLATTDMTATIQGQITGQLYCIRAHVARRLYLPKDLGIDDGFIKAVVCSDFLQYSVDPSRIITVPNASHVYEAYTSVKEILNNQKRQMIGQAIVHVIIEYLRSLPVERRVNLAATLKNLDDKDPDWLKRLLGAHLSRARYFWRLFPDALTFRFRRWWQMPGRKRLTHGPAALAGFLVTMVACARARRHFRRGQFHYWPKASRENIRSLDAGGPDPTAAAPAGT